MNKEIRIVGTGGQGVVLSGIAIGRASSLYECLYAVQTQSYGSDMRGGAVCSEIIISEEPVIYPAATHPDILVVLSQRGYEENIIDLKENGTLITDQTIVKIDSASTFNHKNFSLSFRKIAIEEFDTILVSNMIMLGYLVKNTGIVTLPSIEKAVADLISKDMLDMNLKAIHRGAEST